MAITPISNGDSGLSIRGKINEIIGDYVTGSELSVLAPLASPAFTGAPTINGVSVFPLLKDAPWQLIQSYTTAGTFTWTAPDLFNGEFYIIGVCLIGGGGSGAASKFSGGGYYHSVTGGASGYMTTLTMTVTQGNTYAVIVGAGGVAASTTTAYSNASNGNAGGTSSFNGTTAAGGGCGSYITGSVSTRSPIEGGQPADGIITLGSMKDNRGESPSGGALPYYLSSNVVFSFEPNKCVNPFSPETIMLAAGGYAIGQATYAQAGASAAGGKAGDGAITLSASDITAGSGTGYGCGGGGAIFYNYSAQDTTHTATSGKGADGAVLIYARKAAS